MSEKLKNTNHFLELLWVMTEKELRARYKNTIFGFLWIVVNPLLQMLVIGFTFSLFIKEPINNYFLYLLSGLLVWNFFSQSVSKCTPSIVYERALIKKARFPRSIVPLSIIFSNVFHLVLAYLILFIPVRILNTFSDLWLLQWGAGIILLILLVVGFVLITSALNVRFRDVNFFVQALLILWFYGTPIVYSLNVVPTTAIWIWRLNPLTAIVQLFQAAFSESPSPGLIMLVSNMVIIFFILTLGISIFKNESRNFDDWI